MLIVFFIVSFLFYGIFLIGLYSIIKDIPDVKAYLKENRALLLIIHQKQIENNLPTLNNVEVSYDNL